MKAKHLSICHFSDFPRDNFSTLVAISDQSFRSSRKLVSADITKKYREFFKTDRLPQKPLGKLKYIQ